MFKNLWAVVNARLKFLFNLHLPALLLIAVALLIVQEFNTGNLKMGQNDSERWTVFRFVTQALLDEKLEAFRTGHRDRQLKKVFILQIEWNNYHRGDSHVANGFQHPR